MSESMINGFKGTLGAILALFVFGLTGFVVGLVALSIGIPALTTVPIVVAYGGVGWLSIRTLKKPGNSAFMSGFLVGSIIGCLGAGLCSGYVAAISKGGLNVH